MAGAANTADNASSAKMILLTAAKRSSDRRRMTPGLGGNAATVGTLRGLNGRSVKNAAMTLSSWLSSGAKTRREAATNGQRISASQPSVTFPRAMVQTLDGRPPIITVRG